MNSAIFKTFFLSLYIIANMHWAYADTASILPPAKTTFVDQNGKPLTAGTVDFYIPSTTTRKATWQDAGETILNTNPVVLDAAGRALILGSGSYRQVVKDKLGNTIWDQVTSSSGSGGSASTATGDGDLVGTVKTWAGLIAPNQYLFTYGQELVRATYPALFTAITSTQAVFCNSGSPIITGLADTNNFPIGGSVELSCLAAGHSTIVSKTSSTLTLAANSNITSNVTAVILPWGGGNNTTTFNLPDFRGLSPVGNNIMGGVASTHTSTANYSNFNINPNSIGAIGGTSSTILNSTNLPAYTPTGTVTSTFSAGVVGVPVANLTSVGGATDPNRISLKNNANTDAGSLTAGITSTGTVTSTFVGSQQGGISASFINTPPSNTINFIIKVTPDANSATASGVTSLGGMTGSISCGTNLLCTGNNVSVTGVPTLIGNNIWSGLNTFTNTLSLGVSSSTSGILDFKSVTGITTRLSTAVNSGSTFVTLPSTVGELVSWITPQYVGAFCNGSTDDTTIIQSAISQLSAAYGGIVYFPPGSNCVTSSTIIIDRPNVTFLGVTNKNEVLASSSTLTYSGTGGVGTRFIDARDARGFRIEGMEITYSSSSFAGKLIDLAGVTPGATVNAFTTIYNSRIGPSTDRIGTATLVNAEGTVDLLINRVFFYRGAPALKGQAILSQNVRTTIKETTFTKSDTIPIQECGESWILDGVTFEARSDGTAAAFTNTEAMYCKAMTIKGGWAGDITVAGGTWFTGTWQGLDVSGFQIAGDLGSATQGFNLIGSSAIRFGGGNRFELLNTAINCGSGTANDGITIGGGNKFTFAITKIGNVSNCSNISAEGNSPSTSLFTSGQILIGQSSADAAPKTMSGGATINAAGVVTISAGAAGIAIGTTPITSGTTTRVLYDNAGIVGEYTTAQLTAQINAATTALSGAVPAWPNNTTSFFRGDGTYNAVAFSGLSGLGSGVAGAGAINIGSAGAFVTFNGAGGTPSSLTLTNATGLPTAGMLNSAVTYSKIQDVAGLSVIGRSASTSGVTAAITPGDIKQVLRVDPTGGTIGWGSLDLAYSGVVGTSLLALANGGTNAALTASNGGIFYSTASTGAVLSGTATARQMLQSGAATTPAWSTSTWPATTTINRILYSSAANVISDLATANGGILNTSSSGVPSITPIPVIGVAGTTVGTLGFQNATSGTITLSPVTGALGTVTLSLPARTDTLVTLAGTEALTNKTYNGNTFTAGTGTLTLGASKTATISNTLTFTGTDSSSVAFGTGGTVFYKATTNVLQASPTLPTGTASGTAVMMGMGSTCAITPAIATRVRINFHGTFTDSIAGGIVIDARYGTGSAPANAAAASGTVIGATQQGNVSVGTNSLPFSIGGIITGLTPGTAYWFDMTMLSGGGTVSITTVSCDANEIP